MRSQHVYFLAVVLFVLLSALLVTKASRSKTISQGHATNVAVLNKTSAFQVVKAERVSDKFTLSLKNNYDRRITAFVITVGNTFRITEDFISSELSDEIGIKSQETFRRTYPIPSSEQFEPALDLTLQSVVLDDKTGDGDPIIFEDIRDTRLGHSVQIKRLLRLLDKYIASGFGGNMSPLKYDLQKALDGSETETLTELRELRPLGTINREGKNSLNDFVKEGLEAGKADVLRRMNEVEHSATSTESLLKIKRHYQKLLARF